MMDRSDKGPAFAEFLAAQGVSPDRVAFMGDDLVDLPILLRCGLAFAPADAVAEVRERVHRVLERPRRPGGGAGAVRAAAAGAGELGAADRSLLRGGRAGLSASSRPLRSAPLPGPAAGRSRLPGRSAPRPGPPALPNASGACPAPTALGLRPDPGPPGLAPERPGPPPRPRSPGLRPPRAARGGAPPHRPAGFLSPGMNAAELLHLLRRDAKEILPHLEIQGWENVEAARATGRPILILTGHCGNWELIAVALHERRRAARGRRAAAGRSRASRSCW